MEVSQVTRQSVWVSPPRTGLLLHHAAGCHLAPLCCPSHSYHLFHQASRPEGWQGLEQSQRPCWTQGPLSRCCCSPLHQLLCCLYLLLCVHPLQLLHCPQQLM